MRHIWICDECGYSEYFHFPNIPIDDVRSEAQREKRCPVCKEEMYFDEEEVEEASGEKCPTCNNKMSLDDDELEETGGEK